MNECSQSKKATTQRLNLLCFDFLLWIQSKLASACAEAWWLQKTVSNMIWFFPHMGQSPSPTISDSLVQVSVGWFKICGIHLKLSSSPSVLSSSSYWNSSIVSGLWILKNYKHKFHLSFCLFTWKKQRCLPLQWETLHQPQHPCWKSNVRSGQVLPGIQK